jgi:hypothetical protein
MAFAFSIPRDRFILLIGDEGLLCVRYPQTETPPPFFIHTGDEEGFDLLRTLLAKHAHTPIILLADTLGQDFRCETLPAGLNRFDRIKLIRRRLRQAFPHSRLSASFNLKSDRTRVMLAGIGKEDPACIWLERLAASGKRRPPRLCLLPVESAGIVTQLMPEAATGWAMLVSRQRTGGFRQIVVHKGEMVFTRLTPALPPDAGAQEIAEVLARDIHASLGYLGRLGLANGNALQIAILAVPEGRENLRDKKLPVGSLKILSPHKAAVQLGLPFLPQTDDQFGDLLHAGWIARQKRPRLCLMPHDMRKAQQTAAIRRWGLRLAAMAMILALATTGLRASDLIATVMQSRNEAAHLSNLRNMLAQKQEAEAPETAPLGRLRAALERKRIYTQPTIAPWNVFVSLRNGLGDSARLVRLDWQDDSGKPADEALTIDVRLTETPDVTALSKETSKQDIVGRFHRIADNLTHAAPEYIVEVTHYPFPALPQEALSNEAAKDQTSTGNEIVAGFSMRRAP